MKESRKEYKKNVFLEESLYRTPFAQFEAWFAEAEEKVTTEHNAFALATCSADGRPANRMLLLKEYSEGGFVFYTNYTSRKGLELEVNPKACMLFYWTEIEKQIRIEGKIEKYGSEQSDLYFESRPIGAQAAACVSPQSKEVDRETLEKAWQQLMLEAEKSPLLRPQSWGGYILIPDYFEFWQGRENRLHDRIVYCNNKAAGWEKKRLAP